MQQTLVQTVRRRARDLCEYCQMPQQYSSIPFEIDHIIAQKHHGETVLENLALACYYCNSFKGPCIAGVDSESKKVTPLFHPRLDIWSEHFEWRGAELVGRSAVGRTTVDVLGINAPDYLLLRESLIEERVFPPQTVNPS